MMENFYMPMVDINELTRSNKVKLETGPDLPKITFEKNKIKYSVTDVRYLNKTALYALEQIINKVANEPDVEAISFGFDGGGVSEDEVKIVIDILLGISYTAKKRGKGSIRGTFLVAGCDTTYKKGMCVNLTCRLEKRQVQAIYEYIQGHLNEEMCFGFYDLVAATAKKGLMEMNKWMEEHCEEEKGGETQCH